MLVDRISLMRAINHHPDDKFVRDVAYEANYLYAPLAHRLGLYVIKSELEDMSLKYTNRDTYTRIAHKLNETKVSPRRLHSRLHTAGQGKTRGIGTEIRHKRTHQINIFDLEQNPETAQRHRPYL